MKAAKAHALDKKCEGCDKCSDADAAKLDKKGCGGEKVKAKKSAKTKI